MNQAEVIGREVKNRAEIIGNEVSTRARAVGSEVRERAEWAGRQVRNRTLMARHKAQRTIYEYPLQCLGAVFGIAFLTGITLRIWRTRD